MTEGLLQVEIDVIEPRVRYDRLAVVIDGRMWDLYLSENVGIDPVTNTAILLPLPLSEEWQTTTSGDYARLTRSEYALTTPDSWTSFDRNGLTGNTYLHSLNINEPVYTPEVGRNAPIYLSWYAYNAGNSRFVQMECGWGQGTEFEVSLRIWSDDSVEVWRNGVYVHTGSLTDALDYPPQYGARRGADGGTGRQNAQETVDVLLFPTRGNELIVLSPTQGGGFVVQFADLDPSVGIVTEAGPFWWWVREGQATAQCQAPMRFRTSGTLYSLPTNLRYPPPEGATFAVAAFFNNPASGSAQFSLSVVDANTLAPFVADGTAVATRLCAEFSGDGIATSYLYAGIYSYAGSAEYTAAGTVAFTPYLLAADPPRLSVGDDASQVSLYLTCKEPDALEGEITNVQIGSNRPIQASLVGSGTATFFSGRTNAPQLELRANDLTSRLNIECRDRWKAHESFLLSDPVPLDGLNLANAFLYFATLPGYAESDVDIEPIDFDLPVVAAASKGEWAVIPEAGDTAAQWLQRLHEDFAATYYIGWRPTAAGPKFCVWGTATLGTAALATLYPTVDLAGGTTAYVYRSFRQSVLEPEANDIYAVGQDRRTKLPIVAHIADLDSINPSTAVNARPENWLGERRKYELHAPEIVTQETANWAAGILYQRLTPSRKMAEWRSEFLSDNSGVALWRGDVVHLVGRGRYRIQTIEAAFQHEWNAGTIGTATGFQAIQGTAAPFRECVYTGERIGD